jgi:thiamine pyrophosphokinase
MSRFTILLGGDLDATTTLVEAVHATRVIAADAGMRHAVALGVVPELWVGDFDSVPDGLPQPLAQVPRETFPADKDMTDGELAVDAALRRGATGLLLAGAFGGPRIDHAFLHLTLGLRLAEKGHSVVLSSGNQEGRPLLPGTARFDYPAGTLFSVIAFTPLTGLTIDGAKWPLDRRAMDFGSSLTISNEVRGPLAVTIGEGRAMLIAHIQD